MNPPVFLLFLVRAAAAHHDGLRRVAACPRERDSGGTVDGGNLLRIGPCDQGGQRQGCGERTSCFPTPDPVMVYEPGSKNSGPEGAPSTGSKPPTALMYGPLFALGSKSCAFSAFRSSNAELSSGVDLGSGVVGDSHRSTQARIPRRSTCWWRSRCPPVAGR